MAEQEKFPKMDDLTDSKALVPAGNQAVGAPLPRVDVIGADTLDLSDVAMPRMRLRQPTSQFGEPSDAGKFLNTLTETFSPSISSVILRVSKGRVMFPDTFSKDSKPLCASDDGVHPRPVDGYQEGPCATCPYAQWGADSTPPACSLVYTYLASNVDDEDMPFLISAMRTSAKAAKKLNSLIKMYGLSRRIVIEAELVKGTEGQWYELRFRANGALTRDEQIKYRQIAASMSNVAMGVDTEDQAGMDALDADEEGALPF